MITAYDYWRYLFPLEFAGVLFLVAGLISVRRELSIRPEGLLALGRAFVPAAIATFGAEHLVSGRSMAGMVPSWIPVHVFWVYFFGCAHLAAALSIVSMKFVRLGTALLGLMLLLFVLTIHLPNVIAHPRDRLLWAVATRDTLFALGSWAFASSLTRKTWPVFAPRVISVCRIFIALVLLFYAVEYFLFPRFALGVPLQLPTPATIPARPVWDFVTGGMLAAAGIALLIEKQARAVAAIVGVAIAILTVPVFIAMMAAAVKPFDVTMSLNYVFDNLLFAGSILFLASAITAGAGRLSYGLGAGGGSS